MVDHHDAGTVQALGLVHQQVAALVVHVVSYYKALWREDKTRGERIGVKRKILVR